MVGHLICVECAIQQQSGLEGKVPSPRAPKPVKTPVSSIAPTRGLVRVTFSLDDLPDVGEVSLPAITRSLAMSSSERLSFEKSTPSFWLASAAIGVIGGFLRSGEVAALEPAPEPGGCGGGGGGVAVTVMIVDQQRAESERERVRAIDY